MDKKTYISPCSQFPTENFGFDLSVVGGDVVVTSNPRCLQCLTPERCIEGVRQRISRELEYQVDLIPLEKEYTN